MKERLAGLGLAVGTALTLGMIWADSAQAFSLNSTVTVENFLVVPGTSTKIPYTGNVSIEQGPVPVVVSSDTNPELEQFGGIWDIDLGHNSISFTLNSIFGNVLSGDDVYRFQSQGFGQTGQIPTINIVSFGSFSPDKRPFAEFTNENTLEIIFPLGFAPSGLFPPQVGSKPGSITQLPIEPYAVPTPALLPGLIGMGLAVLRKQRKDDKGV